MATRRAGGGRRARPIRDSAGARAIRQTLLGIPSFRGSFGQRIDRNRVNTGRSG